MKSATRVTSKGRVVIPKPVRLTALAAEDPIDTLYGCLKDVLRDPLADLEAEHQVEMEADEHRQGREPRLLIERDR